MHEEQLEFSRQSTSRAGNVAILGEASVPPNESVRSPFVSLSAMRPCDVTRLLNSTHLGSVINDRQLYRHRQKTGFTIGDRHRIDLVRYVAWLLHERHVAIPERRDVGRRRRDGNADPIRLSDILNLLEQQGYRCKLTGRKLTPKTATLDHILPVTLGGKHCIENAQVLHTDVNRCKGTFRNSEFIQLCREVAEHAASNVDSEGKEGGFKDED